jgi:arylsulfatase A-like enzyme
MQGYFGGITAIDLEFARVLKALGETGHADDTIVIFTSDHGEMMGSQGRMAKGLPFEESCRVPFAVRYPGVTPKGGSSKALFAAIDIYPTVCGLANLPVPAHCMGKDLSAIMRDEKSEAPEIVFLMSGKAKKRAGETMKKGNFSNYVVVRDDQKPPFRGARTTTHTYAVTEEGRWLLYDNVADPYQMNNLANDSAHKPLMAALDVKIQDWMSRTGDTFSYPHLG